MAPTATRTTAPPAAAAMSPMPLPLSPLPWSIVSPKDTGPPMGDAAADSEGTGDRDGVRDTVRVRLAVVAAPLGAEGAGDIVTAPPLLLLPLAILPVYHSPLPPV